MRTIRRGLRGVARARFRAAVFFALLTTGIGLSLTMLSVDDAFATRLAAIRDRVGTGIDVRPAGTFGGSSIGVPGAGPPGAADRFSERDIETIRALPGVTSVSRKLMFEWFSNHLKQGGPAPRMQGVEGDDIQLPLRVSATDSPEALELATGAVGRITEGRSWTAEERDANVVVLGRALAEASDLTVGDTVDLDGFRVTDDLDTLDTVGTATVIGIFETGNTMGDSSLFLPVDTAQRLFGLEDAISEVKVTAASVDQIEAVAEAIRAALGGAEEVDVVTGGSRLAQVAAPLADARASSRLALISALVGSAVVIVLAGLIGARHRIKEMAILKTVGAANWQVVSQFGVETLVLATAGGAAGAAITFPLARNVAKGLFTSPPDVSGATADGLGFSMEPAGTELLRNLGVGVSPVVFLYALGLAVALALVATGVPAWLVGRIRPAEVLRHE